MTNFHRVDDSVWNYVHDDKKIATVIGNDHIIGSLGHGCIEQLVNASKLPGVHEITLNPDAHKGYGVPIGSVISSDGYLYMGAVGYDIKCSMSYLMLDLPAEELKTLKQCRAVLNAITKNVGVGVGQPGLIMEGLDQIDAAKMLTNGFKGAMCNQYKFLEGVEHWVDRCEDASHHMRELEYHAAGRLDDRMWKKMQQMGSLGSGNHFCEAGVCHVQPGQEELSEKWGLKDGHIGVLTHCGSRGLGHTLAGKWFKELKVKFGQWNIPFIGGDRELVYLPDDTPEGIEYQKDLAIAGNFTTLNHIAINRMVLEGFKKVFPGVKGELVYFISHNFVRKEICGNRKRWVHRKGATRAMPAGHPELRGTRWEETGHPILLPGHAITGSSIMVAEPGASISQFSVNHGAGRALGRKDAKRKLDQTKANAEFRQKEIVHNHRDFPLEEACGAYKDYSQVLDSVKTARLAAEVARLEARLLLK